MKKRLFVFGMALLLIFGLVACGSDTQEDAASALGITENDAISYADQLIDSINSIVAQGLQSQYEDEDVISSALSSWESGLEDMGEYTGIAGYEVTMDEDDGVVILVTVTGTERNAEVEIVLDEDLALTSVTTNVEYAFGELMKKAGLNTLLGMGMVFVVLVILCLIIYCFAFIPKIQAAFEKRKKAASDTPAPATAPAAVAAPVVEAAAAESADDEELIAVIAAAIAAYEGSEKPVEGYQVRSIRRRGTSNWKSR